MSSIEQAGLVFLAVFVLIVIGWRSSSRGAPLIREDRDTWWHAHRNWWWKDRP